MAPHLQIGSAVAGIDEATRKALFQMFGLGAALEVDGIGSGGGGKVADPAAHRVGDGLVRRSAQMDAVSRLGLRLQPI